MGCIVTSLLKRLPPALFGRPLQVGNVIGPQKFVEVCESWLEHRLLRKSYVQC